MYACELKFGLPPFPSRGEEGGTRAAAGGRPPRDEPDSQAHTAVKEKPKQKTGKPPMYQVVMLNDDFTPMDFVVRLLEEVFHKETPEAMEIMLTIHTSGKGICGIYTREIAETKATQVLDLARRHQHPLRCEVSAC